MPRPWQPKTWGRSAALAHEEPSSKLSHPLPCRRQASQRPQPPPFPNPPHSSRLLSSVSQDDLRPRGHWPVTGLASLLLETSPLPGGRAHGGWAGRQPEQPSTGRPPTGPRGQLPNSLRSSCDSHTSRASKAEWEVGGAGALTERGRTAPHLGKHCQWALGGRGPAPPAQRRVEE